MNILAIESSCDETAAAVVEDLPAGRQVALKILSNVVASSTAMHEKYGGIVPEVAAREQLKCIIPTIDEALQQSKIYDLRSIDAIAVTIGPGLIGSLLVGVETAKTMAMATGKPIIPVNHVLAHMYANMVIPSETRNLSQSPLLSETPRMTRGDMFPAISLVVSGGHTELFLMTSHKDLKWLGGTLDDAAGEAFDKTARLLGFGNRGGLAIQEAAAKATKYIGAHLPRPLLHDGSLNFSFSGLKTAILREWQKQEKPSDMIVNAFAVEVQEAITDVLVKKTLTAAQMHNVKSILLSGGVAANTRLREKFLSTIHDLKSTISFHVPPVNLCTDNAAYIASYAFFRGDPVDWHTITAMPDLSVEV